MKIDLAINTDLATEILTKFIHSETTRAGFNKVVVGLSGGIDSALSCVLAVKALGPENVLAVRMPYRTSSPRSFNDAQLIIDQFGIQDLTVPISDMADGLISKFPDMSKTRQGNIMARCRMIVLYDQSNAFNGLVIGTSNKTEILLGYSTLFGDSASAFNPIGDLYKTQVRQLSKALDIPDPIIQKAPSADLWANQTDEGELGFTYAEVDKLLYLLIDERYTAQECVEAGFAKDFVDKVVKRVQRYHFKRVLPPIAKLGSRTIGYDFLYLRDWGT